MDFDLYRNGIPEARIPAFVSCEPREVPGVANRIIDYVKSEAQESGIDIGRDYQGGHGRSLRLMLDYAGLRLHMAYTELRNKDKTNVQLYDEFSDCLGRLGDVVAVGKFLDNMKGRKKDVARYHQDSFKFEEVKARIVSSLN